MMIPALDGTLKPAGSGASFDPTSIAGCVFWFDGSNATSLYDATSGGSLVSAGGNVARWNDLSGNNRHATQASSPGRPTRQSSQINSRDAVLFDGSDYLGFPSAYTIPSSFTVFMVFRRATTGINTVPVGQRSNDQAFPFLWASDNVIYQSNNSTPLSFGTSTATGNFVATAVRTGTTSIEIRLNKSTFATVSSGINAVGGLTWSGIGSKEQDEVGVVNHNGLIAEIIGYNSAISSGNITTVENALASKYGIS